MVQVSYTLYSPSLTAQCAEVDIFHDLILNASAGVRYLNSTFGRRALGVIRNALSRYPGISQGQKKCTAENCLAMCDHGEVSAKAPNPTVTLTYPHLTNPL